MFITRKFILKTKSLLTTLELFDTYNLNKHTFETRFYDYILRTTNVIDIKDFTKRYRYLKNRFNRMRRIFSNPVHKAYYDSLETKPLYTLLPEMPYDQTVITNYLGYNYKKYKIISASSNIETEAELMTLITLGIIALINHKEVLAASAS